MQASGNELAVEVPDREAKIFKIKLGRHARRHIKRVDVSKKMPANAVSVYQLQDVRLLFDLLAMTVAKKRRIVILCPSKRWIIYLKISKNVIIKSVFARSKTR